MSYKRRSGGAWTTLTTMKRRSAGAWVNLSVAKRRVAGAWVDLFSGFMAGTTDQNLSAISLTPTDATLSYSIDTGGTVKSAVNGAVATSIETWLISGTSADFQCLATIVSGTFSSGTTGTWLACNTSPVWTRNRTSNTAGVDTVVFTLEIRRVSDSAVVDSSTITLNAEVYV